MKTRHTTLSRKLLAAACGLFVLACGGGDPLEEVRSLHRQGRFEESLEPLVELVDAGSEDPEVLYLYGVALSAARRPSQALWPLRKAMESEEWEVPAALALAAGGLESGNFEEAIDAASRVLELEPDNQRALLIRGTARTHTRKDIDYELAVEDAERVLELDPGNIDALIARATALLALERTDEAGEALAAISEAAEGSRLANVDAARFCTARGVFAMEKGDAEEAEAIHRECLEAHPTSRIVVRTAMEFFEAQQRSDEATAIVLAAHEAAPEDREFRIGYAFRQQITGDLEGAEQTLRAATAIEDPLLAAEAWRDLAGFYAQHQRFDEAVDAYDEALAGIDRPNPDVLFGFGDVLVLAGRHDRALEVASRLESEAHAAMIRGRVHLARKDPEGALEQFAKGLLLWPNNAIARYYAAVAAEQTGRFDRAIEEYRYSVRVEPGGSDGRYRLARILAAQGDDDLAMSALHHALSRAPSTVEMALLELELLARATPLQGSPPPRLLQLVGSPQTWGQAVAAIAEGSWRRAGPAAAVQVVEGSNRLDLAAPANAEALRMLVRAQLASEQAAEARARLEELRSRMGEEASALIHALLGQVHASQGDPQAARAAFERALEIEPGQPEAIAGLASMESESSPEQALALYARGLQDREDLGSPERGRLARARADLLMRLDRRDEAIEQLEQRLLAEPLDAAAASRLAEILAASVDGAGGTGSEATAERARRLSERARRFAAFDDRFEGGPA